jgi:hypothetical protein
MSIVSHRARSAILAIVTRLTIQIRAAASVRKSRLIRLTFRIVVPGRP